MLHLQSLNDNKAPVRNPFALCVVLICSILVNSTIVEAAPNRAIQRAVQSNALQALKRIRLEPRVEAPVGLSRIQTASHTGEQLLLIFDDKKPRLLDFGESRLWDSFDALAEPIIAGAVYEVGTFVTLSSSGALDYWALHESRKPIAHYPVQHPVSNKTPPALFLGRDQRVAILDGGGALTLYYRGKRIRKLALSPESGPRAVAVDSTGEFIAAKTADGNLTVLEMATAIPVSSVPYTENINAIAAGSEAGQLFVAGASGAVEWDMRERLSKGQFGCRNPCTMTQLLYFEQAQQLVGLSAEMEPLQWSTNKPKRRARPKFDLPLGIEETNPEVVKSPSGPLLLSATEEGVVNIYRWAADKEAKPLMLASSRYGWALIDEVGRFDGSVSTPSPITWFDDSHELPLSDFANAYLEPGLLSKWMLDEKSTYLTNPKNLEDGILVPPKMTLKASLLPASGGQQMISVEIERTDKGAGLGELLVYHQGLQVPRESQTEATVSADEKMARDVFVVPALRGRNTFRARVQNKEGIIASGPTSMADHRAPPAPKTLHLLAVAINEYASADGALDLNYAVPDATSIAKAMEVAGEENFDTVDASLLLDANATKSGVVNAIRGLRQAAPEDTVVLYFATHGEVFGDIFYLLLRGLDLPIKTEKLPDIGLSISELADEVRRLSARRVFLLLDTCKSGDAVEILADRAKDQRVLQIFGSNLGLNFVAATAKGQDALEVNTLGHGVFTYTLLEALAGDADRAPRDGTITASEVGGFTSEQVTAMTSQMGLLPQSPTIFSHGYDYPIGKPTAPPQDGD